MKKRTQDIGRDPNKVAAEVEALLDLEFKNQNLLIEALTHRSYLNEHPGHPTSHYERLEFLGDAMLGAIVTEFIFRKFPKATEGELTAYRGALVRTTALSEIGTRLGLLDYVLTSKGLVAEMENGKREREYIACCLVEAIIGALYLDQGLGTCRMWVDHILHPYTTQIISGTIDHLSLFQDDAQRCFGITPSYEVLSESGPDHQKTFEIVCMIGRHQVAKAIGSSKSDAKKAAAKTARETISQWEGRITEVARQASSVVRHSGNRARR